MADGERRVALREEDFEEEGNDYDPLFDEDDERDDDEQAETYGYIGDPGELAARSEVPPAAPRTPQEMIADLFENMPPFKRRFLAIMEYCREQRSLADIDEFIDAMQEQNRSVYTATSFCQMLADVGALEKIDAKGNPYLEVEVEPEEVVDEDGNVCLKPGTPEPAFWRTTDAGLAIVDEDDPVASLCRLAEDEAKYKSIYAKILQLCDEEGGASIARIKDEVNDDPLLAEPRKTAQLFMDRLDRNGAIAWDGAWKTTDIGKKFRALLEG